MTDFALQWTKTDVPLVILHCYKNQTLRGLNSTFLTVSKFKVSFKSRF